MSANNVTPLTLAILALLLEKPMHPYEIAFTMKRRRLEDSIKVRYGSLYQTVDTLERTGLILATRTERQGQRPERTVYSITDRGRSEFFSKLRELALRPSPEYSMFEAVLCFLVHLPPHEAADLLELRAADMEVDLELQRETLSSLVHAGLLRILVVEVELRIERRQADLRWVRSFIEDLRAGRVEWPGPEVNGGYVTLVSGPAAAGAKGRVSRRVT